MTRPRQRNPKQGFTLVELLVAIALLGIILTGLLSLVRGSLRFTSLNSAVSFSVEDVADAEGYLTDKFREAKLVLANIAVLSPGGATLYDCQTLVTNDCVGVLSPVVDTSQASQPIVNFDLSVFVVQPIDALYEDEGLPRGWEGADTLALIEYRNENLCATACDSVPGLLPLSTANRTIDDPPGFLLGNLAATNGAGADVAFFDVIEGGTNLFLNFVVRADSSTSNPYVVSQTPVALQVAVRR